MTLTAYPQSAQAPAGLFARTRRRLRLDLYLMACFGAYLSLFSKSLDTAIWRPIIVGPERLAGGCRVERSLIRL